MIKDCVRKERILVLTPARGHEKKFKTCNIIMMVWSDPDLKLHISYSRPHFFGIELYGVELSFNLRFFALYQEGVMQQFLLDLIVVFPVVFAIFAIVMVEFGDPEMRKSAQEYNKRHGKPNFFS